jgi:hypothetical protein
VTTPKSRASAFSSLVLSRRACQTLLLGLLSFLLCLTAATAGAASPSGDKGHEKPYALIFGTVWGPEDHPLFGVRVKIRRADQKKAKWELFSDHNGEFAQRVPPGPGDYLVTVDLNGYKPSSGKQLQAGQEVKVHIDNDERQDIGLHLKQ